MSVDTYLSSICLSTILACVLVSGFTASLKSQDSFECLEDWGYYENPDNCIKYYRCENGMVHSLTCRKGNLRRPTFMGNDIYIYIE